MEHAYVDFLKGLIHVTPPTWTGKCFRQVLFGGFAIDMYEDLLHVRQQTYPELVWQYVYLRLHYRVWGGGGGTHRIRGGGFLRLTVC